MCILSLSHGNHVIISIPISPHTLRHSKEIYLLEAGVNFVYIRDFLGHSYITITEIYARANPEIKRNPIKRAGILIFLKKNSI
ncbi:tyrosine-type recombinase/integrase [Clostridium sp. WB02_MRS01]|nr:tyrosine-type recombinase/integrase [Clostridium sp. WB02_MRS01]